MRDSTTKGCQSSSDLRNEMVSDATTGYQPRSSKIAQTPFRRSRSKRPMSAIDR